MCKESNSKIAASQSICSTNTPSRRRIPGVNNGIILKILYIITCFLSLFMVLWIVVFPSSWLMGRSDLHDQYVNETMVVIYDGTQVPPATVTKYKGHALIQFTHILPGALWAGAIPFQLHPEMRRKYRTAHKVTGYIFLTTSMVMAFGIFVILARNMTFHNDYQSDIAPPADNLELLQMKISSSILTTWFAFTAVAAIHKIRTKDFQSHRDFIIRHICSGIWIALQRIIVLVSQAVGLVEGPLQMRNLFGNAAMGGALFTILASECAIHLLRKKGDIVPAAQSKAKSL